MHNAKRIKLYTVAKLYVVILGLKFWVCSIWSFANALFADIPEITGHDQRTDTEHSARGNSSWMMNLEPRLEPFNIRLSNISVNSQKTDTIKNAVRRHMTMHALDDFRPYGRRKSSGPARLLPPMNRSWSQQCNGYIVSFVCTTQ